MSNSKVIKWFGSLAKVLIVGFLAVIAITVLLIIFAIWHHDHNTNSQRNALATRYSKVVLPSYITYQSRNAEGDGVDSRPYWYYTYTTAKDIATTGSDIQTTLKAAGYTVDNTVPATVNPYTFGASNPVANVELTINISNLNKILITVQSLQND